MKITCILWAAAIGNAALCPAALIENFDNINTLSASGWTVTNNSQAPGNSWFQGNTSVFSAFQGSSNSYIAANFLASGSGNVSLWLLSPLLQINNGDSISFYTRTESGALPGDRLELRLSTAGNSANVGSTSNSAGDFSNLLLAVNASGGSGYPQSWTQFSATVSGLSGPVSGRLGFRYAVTDVSANGDYIGIDSFTTSSTAIPEPGSALLLTSGIAGLIVSARRRREN